MLHRHDYVTPYIDGVRFFDKPPLMYWMAASSMRVFGIHDWAARLPLALCVLALLLATYGLGIRLFAAISPAKNPDRGGFYAALALATSIGPYLYTRFYIPDILLALWMTLAVHLFLIALDRLQPKLEPLHRLSEESPLRVPRVSILRHGSSPDTAFTATPQTSALSTERSNSVQGMPLRDSEENPASSFSPQGSALLPCLAFAAVLALNVLTKGLIGLVFPIAFVVLYLAITRQLRLLPKLHLLPSTLIFLLIASPWHVLAALRNPPIALPPGLGLPTHGGWAWFYLYNEHIARFLGRRIPHDYGLTPVWLFWLYLAIWIMPWTTFVPSAITHHLRSLRKRRYFLMARSANESPEVVASWKQAETSAVWSDRQNALTLLLWAAIVLAFFSLSNRQEYYSLPAIPALALMAAGLLARADAKSGGESKPGHQTSFKKEDSVLSTGGAPLRRSGDIPTSPSSASASQTAAKSALRWHLFFLLPLATLIAVLCAWFALTAPHSAPDTDLSTLLGANPAFYNLSLGHLFDLTGAAMGLFRGPLAAVALSMVVLGSGSYLLRRANRTYAANLTLAAAMAVSLLAAHEGLARFYPILGSKPLAEAINQARQASPAPNDLILLDGELTSGSTLIFYTGQQVHLLNGRVNGLWYGSFWPDAPAIFETESTLRQLWAGPRRIFFFTYNPAARAHDLATYAPVHTLANAGGKTVLTNR